MKVGSINSSVTGYGMDAQTKPVDAKPVEVKQPIKAVSTEKAEAKVKSDTQVSGEEEKQTVNEDMLNKSIEQANKSLAVHNRFIERSVHDVTHTVMYAVKDSVTNEVIAEFPPKKIQDMIAKMWELAGLVVDEKA